MFIFWISAAGTSHFSCDDLVNACNSCDIYYGHLECPCSSYWWVKRDTSPNPNPGLSAGLEKRRSSRRRGRSSGGTLVAREALDAIMVYVTYSLLSRDAKTVNTTSQRSLLHHPLWYRLVDMAEPQHQRPRRCCLRPQRRERCCRASSPSRGEETRQRIQQRCASASRQSRQWHLRTILPATADLYPTTTAGLPGISAAGTGLPTAIIPRAAAAAASTVYGLLCSA